MSSKHVHCTFYNTALIGDRKTKVFSTETKLSPQCLCHLPTKQGMETANLDKGRKNKVRIAFFSGLKKKKELSPPFGFIQGGGKVSLHVIPREK